MKRRIYFLSCLLLSLLVAAPGCDRSSGVDDVQYPCTTDEECGDGFFCAPGGDTGVCVPDGTPTDTDDAANDAEDVSDSTDTPDVADGPDVVSLELESDRVIVTRMLTTSSGAFVVTGIFESSLEVGGQVVSSLGVQDGFVLLVEPDGTVGWLRRLGTADESETYADFLTSAAINSDDALVLAGSSNRGLYYQDEQILSPADPEDPGIQAFAMSTTLGGDVEWSNLFGTSETVAAPQADGVSDVDVLDNGTSILGGLFEGCLHTLPQDIVEDCPDRAAGPTDGFIMALDDRGIERWRTVFASPDFEIVNWVSSGLSRVAFVAELERFVEIDGQQFPPTATQDGKDRIIGELDADDGALVWAEIPGGSDQVAFSGLAHVRGQPILTGWFGDGVSIGGQSPTPRGARDGLVMGLDDEGGIDFIDILQGDGDEEVIRSLHVDSGGQLLLGLQYSGNAEFAGASLDGEEMLDAAVASIEPGGELRWLENFAFNGDVSLARAASSQGRVGVALTTAGRAEFRETTISNDSGGTFVVLFDEPAAD